MAKDLLFEVGTEEMPSKFMPDALNELKKLAQVSFREARLHYAAIQTMGTPRRLTLMVEGLAEKQAEALKEVRGPKREKAFDRDGRPTAAAIGFAKSQGIDPSQLVVKENGGSEYVYALQREDSRSALEVLPGLLLKMLQSVPFPKTMRWGYSEMRFPRPIRWIVALFGNEVIPLEIEHIKSDRLTYGHRFMAPGAIKLKQPDEYISKLKKAMVLVDPDERRNLIWEQVQATAASIGGYVKADQDLLEEINFLVEWPTSFLGEFSSDYLAITPEVLITTMKEHQRYFPVSLPEGALMPYFIGVSNSSPANTEVVKAGNQRVLKARLEDAYFFYREDTKEPLINKTEQLKNVVYQQRLGTVWAKVERLERLALFIAAEMNMAEVDKVKRAAWLCKADLETAMVYEFPELQGVMGRNYALFDGEDPEVAQAIYEHYLPRGIMDELPQTPTGIVLSLAEKLDNLVGLFAIGIKPTGSQDQYALRRQAIGLVNIILECDLGIDLEKVIRAAYREFAGIKLDLDEDQLAAELREFILVRMRGILSDEGLSYDVLDAVFSRPLNHLPLIRKRARALADLRQETYFDDVMVAFNRAYNLARKGQGRPVDVSLFQDEIENMLYNVVKRERKQSDQFLENQDYVSYLMNLADFRSVLDSFFEKIMVMVEDEAVRENRLGLLNMVVEVFMSFADFSKLVV